MTEPTHYTIGPKPSPEQFIGKWTPASGKCAFTEDEFGQECEATLEVKLADGWGTFICARGHEEEDAIGWTWYKKTVDVKGTGYWPFSAVSNHSPCAACGRIVYDIPLILWGPNAPKNVEWELHFCFDCVGKLGLDSILIAQKRDSRTVPGGDNPDE